MWRTFEAWDLLQMLLSDEIYLDAMMLPPFRAIGTTIIHEHWQLGHYRNWVLKFCLSHYSQSTDLKMPSFCGLTPHFFLLLTRTVAEKP
jgi:hypothetical protein